MAGCQMPTAALSLPLLGKGRKHSEKPGGSGYKDGYRQGDPLLITVTGETDSTWRKII